MSEERIPADELIALARRAYSQCSSYADNGEQTTRFETAGAPEMLQGVRTQRFLTRWKRPDRFRFEFRTFGPDQEAARDHYAIWTSAEGVCSWWTLRPEVAERDSLEHALRVAAGVSGGCSWRIASLLGAITGPAHWFPGSSGFQGEPTVLDGRECLCIPMHIRGDSQRLWIERRSGHVLRLDEERLLAEQRGKGSRDFQSRSSTLFRPQLDPELAPEDFVFVPPSGS